MALESTDDLGDASAGSTMAWANAAAVNAPPAGPSQAAEISFVSGVSASGTVVATAFDTWAGTTPATYNSTTTAQKWGTSQVPGTAGGTVDYIFNAASNWTTSEEAVFQSSMALWSAEANITFVQVSIAAQAQLTISRGSDGGAYESSNTNGNVAVGSTRVGKTTSALVSIDTSVSGFGPIASVNGSGGYPAGTVLHEFGHVLGLGHDGPYNGNVNSATQQYSAYDTTQWSVMSYIGPADSSAEYTSSYTVTGTNWGTVQIPETPMPDDILAAQQLYGAPTSTPLSGGQVFGFDSNITGALANYFNFNDNTAPVLTIYDQGTGNTLDLSGYASASTVNLNAGTFSSVDGMTNNIGIAYNTTVDTALGGAGNDSFTVNTDADTIDGGAGTNAAVFAGNRATYTLTRSGSTILATNTSTSITDTLTNIQTLQFADTSVAASSIACYLAGTLVATPSGEVAVETLAIGDRLLTAAGPARPIRWIGRRHYNGRFLAGNPGVLPIRFKPGALADGIPRRDLFVSPEHAMFVDGVLIPARLLVNGATIVQAAARETVAYYHLELETHDVILAEGAPSETFVDNGSRGVFHNAGAYRALYPDAQRQPARFCAPRLEHGARLDAICRRIGARVPGQYHFGPRAGLEGFVDHVSRSLIRGWARYPGHRIPVLLHIRANGVALGTVQACDHRTDLETAGIGRGCHAFTFDIPGGLTPAMHHRIDVCDSTGNHLSGSPWSFEAEAAA